MNINDISRIEKALANGAQEQAQSVVGVVTRVENDGTVWFHLAGGVEETPARATSSSVSAGDEVMVQVYGGQAVITGNLTSPSTDDTQANKAHDVAQTAQVAADAAQGSVDDLKQYFWHDESGAHVKDEAGAESVWKGNKLAFIDSDGDEASAFGPISSRVGREDDGNVEITRDGIVLKYVMLQYITSLSGIVAAGAGQVLSYSFSMPLYTFNYAVATITGIGLNNTADNSKVYFRRGTTIVNAMKQECSNGVLTMEFDIPDELSRGGEFVIRAGAFSQRVSVTVELWSKVGQMTGFKVKQGSMNVERDIRAGGSVNADMIGADVIISNRSMSAEYTQALEFYSGGHADPIGTRYEQQGTPETSIGTGASYKPLGTYIDLTAGTYIIVASAWFASNTVGRRGLRIEYTELPVAETYSWTGMTRSTVNNTPVSGASTVLQTVVVVSINNSYRYAPWALQTSGGSLDVSNVDIRAVRIA